MKHLPTLFFALALTVICGNIQAQSDLTADNTTIAPSNLAAIFKSNDNVTIGELMASNVADKPLVNIKCNTPTNVQVKFFNMDGNMVKQESYALTIGVNELNVNAADLSAGTYMVQFYSKDGSAVRRLVKAN